MRRILLFLSVAVPGAVYANPPIATTPPAIVFSASISPFPVLSALPAVPQTLIPSPVVPATPFHTPLFPLSPLPRPSVVIPPIDASIRVAYPDAVSVIARWNASVVDPARRVYIHPDAGHFTLTVGGTRVLSPSSYQGLWLAAMRPGKRPEDLPLADRIAMRDFAEGLASYQADYRAAWERERGRTRPAVRPADPLQAALWDLDARVALIGVSNKHPRLSESANAFLRSVDMHRLLGAVERNPVGDSGMNLATALWRYDLSFAPVGDPYPTGILVFDNRTGRSLSLPDYIAAGFPERIR